MSSVSDLPPPDMPSGGIGDLPPPDSDQYQMPDSIASLPGRALDAVRTGVSKLDSYTAAPARAAVYAAETSPTELGRPLAGAKAFANQFGADPSTAPTGLDIMNASGYVKPDSTLAKIGGFGADMLINPVNVLPVGGAAAGLAGLVKDGAADAADAVSGGLRGVAKKLAIKATGATGKDAADFAPDIGDDLLDNVVKFGSSPASIAKNAQAKIDAAEASKQALINGPLKDATVDRNNIYNALGNQITALSRDESKLGVVKQLQKIQDDVTTVGSESGSELPLSQSEDVRRGFDKKAKWDSGSDADTTEANKIASNIYRQAGEDAATAVDPQYGAQFKAAKTLQSRLIPVQEAAEKRALQLQQSPHGGLLDIAAVSGGAEVGSRVGEAVAGDPGKVIGAAVGGGVGYAAKTLRPRYAAMGASLANNASQAVAAAPGAISAAAAPVSEVAARYAAIPGQSAAQSANNQVNRSPAKGPDAWAQSGLQKLNIQDTGLTQRLLADPKGKQLLIQASDLAPGSVAMSKVMQQIRAGWG